MALDRILARANLPDGRSGVDIGVKDGPHRHAQSNQARGAPLGASTSARPARPAASIFSETIRKILA